MLTRTETGALSQGELGLATGLAVVVIVLVLVVLTVLLARVIFAVLPIVLLVAVVVIVLLLPVVPGLFLLPVCARHDQHSTHRKTKRNVPDNLLPVSDAPDRIAVGLDDLRQAVAVGEAVTVVPRRPVVVVRGEAAVVARLERGGRGGRDLGEERHGRGGGEDELDKGGPVEHRMQKARTRMYARAGSMLGSSPRRPMGSFHTTRGPVSRT